MFRIKTALLAGIMLGIGVLAAEGQTCPSALDPTDSCSDALVIDGSIGHHVVFMDATTATPGGTQVYTTAGHTVWFSVTPEVSAPMTITTCHPYTKYDTILEVYSGGDSGCEFMTLVAWDDDTTLPECINDCSNYSSSITLSATAGTQYRFVVGSYNNNQAGCDLCLAVRVTIGEPCGEPPAVGGCYNAYELTGSAGLHEVTMDVQSSWGHYVWEADPLCPGVYEIGHTVWFKVTPEVSGTMTFSTCHPNTTYDTVLFAFEGDCEAYEYIGCSDDEQAPECDNGCSFYGGRLTLDVMAGQPYWFWIGSYRNNIAGCDLCLGVTLEIEDVCATDVTPPIADLTAPPDLGTACTCAGLVSITGTADDPDGIFYAYGLDIRPAGGGAWENIAVSTDPVTDGELALWDASGFAQGYYLLKLSVANICGAISTDDVVFYLDAQFDNVTVRYPPLPSPQWPVVRGNVCVDGTVFESWCWHPGPTEAGYQIEYRPSGGATWLPVDPAQPVYTQTVVNDPLGSWDTVGLAIPDGTYELRVTAFDDCDFGDSETRQVIVDNTRPVAVITSLLPCSPIDELVAINGTAADANLDHWYLEYTSEDGVWIPLAEGSQNVVNGPLYVWDVADIPACACTLRLRVYDTSVADCGSPVRQQTDAMVSVRIAGGECIGDLTGDGVVDLFDLAELLGRWGDICE